MKKSRNDKKPLFKMLSSAGASFSNWVALLVDNKFRIGFRHIPDAILVTLITFFLTPFVLLEKMLYDKKIKKTNVTSPVFIIGHMRSGTTFLHYLLSQDKNFTYASTTESIFPWVFITLNKFLRKFMNNILPEKRPMDGMHMSEHLPQEEEFAIANLCRYSPNNGVYFPKNIEKYYTLYSFFENVDGKVINKWKNVYRFFLQKLTYTSGGKRILSKSIVNSCRIKLLLDVFPDAKFIFIYRNPYKVFLSSKKLYKKFIFPNMTFQDISDDRLEDVILKIAGKGFMKYFEEKKLVKEGNLIEIQFEDFVKHPLDKLKDIYTTLSLGDFETVKPQFLELIKDYENYQADKYDIPEEVRERVYNELEFVFKQYGYSK